LHLPVGSSRAGRRINAQWPVILYEIEWANIGPIQGAGRSLHRHLMPLAHQIAK
jgi:hypothetical protein